MASKGFSVDTITRVFDDTTGYYFEVGVDDDALGLITIKCGESIYKPEYTLPGMEPEQAELLGRALIAEAERHYAAKAAK